MGWDGMDGWREGSFSHSSVRFVRLIRSLFWVGGLGWFCEIYRPGRGWVRQGMVWYGMSPYRNRLMMMKVVTAMQSESESGIQSSVNCNQSIKQSIDLSIDLSINQSPTP